MKIKSQYFALIGILFVGGVIGILFFTPETMKSLFSSAVDSEIAETLVVEGEDPKLVVESLDGEFSEEMPINFDTMIQDLKQELLETQNDPDKAMELRRRIQILQTQQATPTPPIDTPILQKP